MKRGICALLIILFFGLSNREVVMGDVLEETSAQESIVVEELDMGEYSDKMVVGERQLLSVTVLPFEATDTKMIYESSSPEIATINGMGRITAVKVGITTITVSCGEVTESFTLQVVEEEDATIAVADIEIGNHEDKVNVGETLTISAIVLPTDATHSAITYKSSNETIATVNSSGEVKGVSKGEVIIYVIADNVTKEVLLTVKVPTTGIKVNNDYLVLKLGSTFQLSANVTPFDANQSVTFRAIDESIATVSKSGLVTAQKPGNTTILISNGDTSVAVSVIVNQHTTDLNNGNTTEPTIGEVKEYAESIKSSEVDKIDSDILYHFYSTGKILEIVGEGYKIEIDGQNIVNYKNEFYTDIDLVQNEEGISFNLNQGNFLCGVINLYLDEPEGKYLYLYNTSKEKYELIQTDSLKELKLTTAGEYQITEQKINHGSAAVIYFIAFGVIAMLIGVGAYIVVKKKYWFW